MFRQLTVGLVLLISAIFLFSTHVFGQTADGDQMGKGLAESAGSTSIDEFTPRTPPPAFAEREDKDLIAQAVDLLKRVIDKTKSLIPSDPEIDRPGELEKLRTLRQEVISLSSLLKNYADDLWSDRRNFQNYRNEIGTDSASRIQFNIDGLNLERIKIQLDELEKQKAAVANGATSEIDKKISDLKDFYERGQSEFASLEKSKARAIERDNRASAELKRVDEEISKFSVAIRDADNTTRSLSTYLGRLDDLSGAVLTTETLSNSYTNTSTIIFSILVGGVILGFFGIAFRSEKVRDAIFSGESGIQFVTLFSLVIAIILFGVLGILEGKELSALLGGLSGYILGRGSFQTPPKQGGTGAAAAPAPAQAVQQAESQ